MVKSFQKHDWIILFHSKLKESCNVMKARVSDVINKQIVNEFSPFAHSVRNISFLLVFVSHHLMVFKISGAPVPRGQSVALVTFIMNRLDTSPACVDLHRL